MSNPVLHVVRTDGMHGTLVPAPAAANGELQMQTTFDDDTTMIVPNTLLTRHADGTFRLAIEGAALNQLNDADQIVLPVIAETLHVEKRRVESGGVRVQKIVREHQEVVEEPILRESVEVERVAMNQFVPEGTSVEIRQEGDVLVIPVLEEVIVLQKRLMLKEEIRITKRSQQIIEPQAVTLRREEIVIEQLGEQAGETKQR